MYGVVVSVPTRDEPAKNPTWLIEPEHAVAVVLSVKDWPKTTVEPPDGLVMLTTGLAPALRQPVTVMAWTGESAERPEVPTARAKT